MVAMIDYENLRKLLDYDPNTGIFTNKIKRGKVLPGSMAGSKHNAGYLTIRIHGKAYLSHRLAWLYMYGVWPEKTIDHINGDKADNRIVNLREATNEENNRNKNAYTNNTSGFKGVYFYKHLGSWIGHVCVLDKRYSTASYKTAIEAAKAVAQLREDLHGKFANHGEILEEI